MTAEADIAAIADGGNNSPADVRTAMTSILERSNSATTWTPYTVTWDALTTSPAIGNGTLEGWYMQYGTTVVFSIRMIMGSTTTYGSGIWTWSLPATPASGDLTMIGTAFLNDSGTASRIGGMVYESTGSYIYGYVTGTTNSVGPTTPHTWASGDHLTIEGTFEATTSAGTNFGPGSNNLIEEIVLSADGTITFDNIPQGYTDLRIVGRLRGANAVNSSTITMRVGNGTVDSGSNYSYGFTYDRSLTTDGIIESSSNTQAHMVLMPGDNTTAGEFGAVAFDILDYTDTSRNRVFLSHGQSHDSTSGATISVGGGEWANTADSIDIIRVGSDAMASLKSGSYLRLYGLPAYGGQGGNAFSGVSANRITSTQGLTSTANTPLQWNGEDFDTDAYHDNSTNPSRFTVPNNGYYSVSGAAYFTGVTGSVILRLYVDGVEEKWLYRDDPVTDSGDYMVPFSQVVQLSAGQYVEIYAQITGSTITFYNGRSHCQVTRLGLS